MLLKDSYSEKIDKEIFVSSFSQTENEKIINSLASEAASKNLSYGQLMALKYKENGRYV